MAHLPGLPGQRRHHAEDHTATKSQRELLKQLEKAARKAAHEAEKAAKKPAKTPVGTHPPTPGKGNGNAAKPGNKHTGTTGSHHRLGTGSRHNTGGAQGLTGGVTLGTTPAPNPVRAHPAPHHPAPRPSHSRHPSPRPQPKPEPKPTAHTHVLPPLADRNNLSLQSPGVLAMLGGLALVVLAAMGYVLWSGRRGHS